MKRYMLLFIGMAIYAPTVFASEAVELCKKMYPLPERNINDIVESTGHDPRQFLIRRCIQKERKRMAAEKRSERQQIRHTARFNKSSDRANRIQARRDKGLNRDLKQQQNYKQTLRVAPHRLGRSSFVNARASRRAIIRETEGLDRVNAIRRRLRAKYTEDPCKSVGAIRQYNNPCRNYGSQAGEER